MRKYIKMNIKVGMRPKNGVVECRIAKAKLYRGNSWYLKKYSWSWSRNSANKVWYWPWFVRPWSIGRTQYILRVLIFFFLQTYLITRTRASENWHSSRATRSILIMKRFKIAPIRFAFRVNVSTPSIHRKCAGDPLNRSPNMVSCNRSQDSLMVMTTDQLLWRQIRISWPDQQE